MQGNFPSRSGIVPRIQTEWFQSRREGKSVKKVTTVRIDLAKRVFSVHGIDTRGIVVIRQTCDEIGWSSW
jgi:hypothetical protein